MQPSVLKTMLYESMFDELTNDSYAIISKYTVSRNNILIVCSLYVICILNELNY